MPPKAKHLKNLFALDLGTTKFCLATVRQNAVGQQQVETVSVPAEGMRRGMLSNVAEARVAINGLLELAERQFGADINKVVVGIAGSHLAGQTISTSVAVQGETVTGRDMQALIEKVESQYASDSRELLHTVPVGYKVDQRETTDDPRGFRGKALTGEFFLIDADKFYLRDVVDVCNECGLQVTRLYSEPFASASVTVPDSHKNLGVAMADIGGGTTDGLVFKGGRPVAVFTVNVAGKLMTNDLAIGLSTSHEEAEKVKIRFGVKPRPGDSLEIRDVRGVARTITAKDVSPILLPRIHELGGLIAQSLIPFRGSLGGGLLLTGGGADVKGIAEYFHTKMHVPVQRARPVLEGEGPLSRQPGKHGVDADAVLHRSTHPSKHATVIGLLNLELGRLGEQQKNRKNTWSNRYIGQFVNWIKELS